MRESWHSMSRPVWWDGGIAWGDNLWTDSCHRVISFSGFQLPPDFEKKPSFLTVDLETARDPWGMAQISQVIGCQKGPLKWTYTNFEP